MIPKIKKPNSCCVSAFILSSSIQIRNHFLLRYLFLPVILFTWLFAGSPSLTSHSSLGKILSYCYFPLILSMILMWLMGLIVIWHWSSIILLNSFLSFPSMDFWGSSFNIGFLILSIKVFFSFLVFLGFTLFLLSLVSSFVLRLVVACFHYSVDFSFNSLIASSHWVCWFSLLPLEFMHLILHSFKVYWLELLTRAFTSSRHSLPHCLVKIDLPIAPVNICLGTLYFTHTI